MKTLYLLRHAKSSWQSLELDDFDRPLLEKGLKRSQLIIDYLLDKQVNVDLIISSSAARARQTAEIFAQAFNYEQERIIFEKKIYYGDTDKLFELFIDIPSWVNSLLIVGHNPAITNFSNHFLDNKIDYLPTSGMVSISFETNDWAEIASAKRRTNFVVYPKMFVKE